jgi:Ca-activated chloride channel homolog
MTASTTLPILNEADYQRYRVPQDLAFFGSLQTTAGYLPLQQMEIQGHIVGLFYRLKLRQRFFNAYPRPLEAIYIFPLPARSAVSAFVMTTQQRRVVGKLEERGEARRQYQQAISQGKQAALAEEDRPEVFTMTVGNIPPQEFVEIEIELDGPLTWSDGEAMFRFPLVVAPRYIPGMPYSDSVGTGTQADTHAVPDASRISPPLLLAGYPNPVRLSVEINVHNGGLNLGLPVVSIPDLMCWQEPGGFRMSLQPTSNQLDRDLIVRFPLPSPHLQSSFQAQSHGPDQHYFALNLVPDDLHQRGYQQPRQIVALLDRSGSMEGWKMVCARRAVGRLIDSFSDHDSFQVMNFDTVVEHLDPHKPHLRPGSDRERFLAMEQLGKVKERGGTEIMRALESGVALLRGQANPFLVLVTDGQVGNESEVLRWVQQNARGIRIFTVGIDRSVNAGLLERIAQVTGGHFTLVEDEEQLDVAMVGLRQRISPPLLRSVRVLLPRAVSAPQEIDLYAGLCSRLMGRCEGPLPTEVEVVGVSADGRGFRSRVPVTAATGVDLQKMWARERVLELEHGFLAGWRQPGYTPQAIAQFALQHGVLCRFTAFVAVDEQSYVPGTPQQVTQAVSQPEGWASAAGGLGSAKRSMMASGMSAGKAAKPGLSRSTGAARAGMRKEEQAGSFDQMCASPAPAMDAFAAPVDYSSTLQEKVNTSDALERLVKEKPTKVAEMLKSTWVGDSSAPASPPPPPAPPMLRRRSQAPGSAWTPTDPGGVPGGPPAAWNPPTAPMRPGPVDEVQEGLRQLRGASSVQALEAALRLLVEALIRRGYTLDQLQPLHGMIQHLLTLPFAASGFEVSSWARQCEDWLDHALRNPTSPRAENFWMRG